MSTKKPFHLSLAGNIATGKSTLYEQVCLWYETAGAKVFRLIEDVQRMKETTVRGEVVKPLALSYENPERYKGSTQLYFYSLRYFEHERIQREAAEYQANHPDQDVFIISERSAPDDYIFYRYGCAMTNEDGKSIMDPMDSVNYELIRQMRPLVEVDMHIYVKTDPEECQRRANARKRSEDASLPLDLFVDIHDLHEQVYNGKTLDHPVPQEPIHPSKVLVLTNDTPVSEETRESFKHPLLAKIHKGVACACA